MIDITNLENAYSTLNECYKDYEGNQTSVFLEYIADSCVKRFEYTLETAWKLVKKILIQKYGKTDAELTMNNIFRFMQGYGYAEDWERWRNYYEKRNNTALEYNLVKARTLIDLVPDFLKDTKFLISKLKETENAN